MKKYILITALIVILTFTGCVDAIDSKNKDKKILAGSNKKAVDFSWNGHFNVGEDKSIRVKVYDKSYIHTKKVNGKEKDFVNFLVFHNNKSGWGKSIKYLPKQKFKGPGGYVEKTNLFLIKVGDKWIGKITIVPKKSIKTIQVWKFKNTGKEYFGVDIKIPGSNKRFKSSNESSKSNSNEINKLNKLTKNGNFESVVNLLKTPEKILNYESRHFEHYLDKHDERPKGFVEFTPRKIFNEQLGSCSSFSVFESYVLDKHDFDVFTLYYISEFNNISPTYGNIYGHTITIYKDNGKYKYLTNIGNSKFAIYGPYNEITDILSKEEERTNGKIFYHGYVHLGYIGKQIEFNNFEEAVVGLKTPQQILNYIARNFELDKNNTNAIRTYEETFQNKKGTRKDLYSFISHVLNENGYKTNILKYQAEINGKDITKSLIIYKHNNNWKSIIDYTFSEPLNLRSVRNYSSIEEILKHIETFEDIRRKDSYEIIKYGLIEAGETDFTIDNWIYF